jgi:hypothetical protein
MKRIYWFFVLLLGVSMMFSCSSDSKDDYIVDKVCSIFPYNALTQKLKAGDSVVIKSRTPFYVREVSFVGNMPTYNVDYDKYQYQKIKFNWLTITHATDTTLTLKVDSSFGSNTIKIQADAVGILKGCICENGLVTVVRDSIKTKK